MKSSNFGKKFHNLTKVEFKNEVTEKLVQAMGEFSFRKCSTDL